MTRSDPPDDAAGGEELQLDAFAVDVRDLLSRTVASLYSHLITRPTGRAVRMAIEAQLREIRTPALSFVDFSSVSILDYSCADEVVAKLLIGLREGDPVSGDVYVYFRGLSSFHLDPIEVVLERHGLHAVVEDSLHSASVLGPIPPAEHALWQAVEAAGRVSGAEVGALLESSEVDASALPGLLRARSLFRHPHRGDLYSLSELARLLDASSDRQRDSAVGPDPSDSNDRED